MSDFAFKKQQSYVLSQLIPCVADLANRWDLEAPSCDVHLREFIGSHSLYKQLEESSHSTCVINEAFYHRGSRSVISRETEKDLFEYCCRTKQALNYLLVCGRSKCVTCKYNGELRIREGVQCWFYDTAHELYPGAIGTVFNKQCPSCKSVYFYDHYKCAKSNCRVYYGTEYRLSQKWWSVSGRTMLSVKMMEHCSYDMKYSHSGMSTMADKWNAIRGRFTTRKRGSILRSMRDIEKQEKNKKELEKRKQKKNKSELVADGTIEKKDVIMLDKVSLKSICAEYDSDKDETYEYSGDLDEYSYECSEDEAGDEEGLRAVSQVLCEFEDSEFEDDDSLYEFGEDEDEESDESDEKSCGTVANGSDFYGGKNHEKRFARVSEERLISFTNRQVLYRKTLSKGLYQWMLAVLVDVYVAKDEVKECLQKKPDEKFKAYLSRCNQYYSKGFVLKWSAHECKYPGCCDFVIMDGNHKCKSKICCNREKDGSVIDIYGLQIPKGCTNFPKPGSLYCGECLDSVKDAITNGEFDKRVKAWNKKNGRGQKYLVEYIDDYKENDGKNMYHVKWLGYNERSWESKDNLTPQLMDMFWDQNAGRKTKFRKVFVWTTSDAACLSDKLVENNRRSKKDEKPRRKNKPNSRYCNTRKDIVYKSDPLYVKQRRSAGVGTMTSPCMIIRNLTIFYRSESLAQWWASLCSYYDTLVEAKLVSNCGFSIIYDDACHLSKYCENRKRSRINDTTRWLASVKKVLDRMHGRNHIEKCRKLFDIPFREDKELFVGVNTEACEALFKWLSAFKHITNNMEMRTYELLMWFMAHMWNVEKQWQINQEPSLQYWWQLLIMSTGSPANFFDEYLNGINLE